MNKELVWAHSCCSINDLTKAINNENINAIEVDITYNHVLNIAVMKHANESKTENIKDEVTIKDWIKCLINSKESEKYIIKLDFKHLQSVPLVIDHLLNEKVHNHVLEIWLNADILHGPGIYDHNKHKHEPVDAIEFLNYCKKLSNYNTTLSLGWKTDLNIFNVIETGKAYSNDHIQQMLDICNNTDLVDENQSLTFPIRASLAKISLQELERLLHLDSYTNKNRPKPTLTLWTGAEGIPNKDLEIIDQLASNKKYQFHKDIDKGSKLGFDSKRRHILSVYYGTKGVSFKKLLSLIGEYLFWK